jgi:hypothetical protein
LVQTLEKYEENEQRPKVFSKKNEDEKIEGSNEIKKAQANNEELPIERFKNLSFELLDMGLFQSQKGYNYFKQTPVFEITDQYVHYDSTLEVVKDKGVNIYKYVNENVIDPLMNNIYLIQTTNYYSFMMNILKEHQPRVITYIQEQYENVKVMMQDNWMKLDFNNDGKISVEDLKKGAHDLYEFITNYDLIVKANEIKNTLYDEAIKFMKSDNHRDNSARAI